MSKSPYRPRVGIEGDTVFEKKSWWIRLIFILPLSINLGWYPYCNAASSRNRHIKKLNALSDKILKELVEYAQSEAMLRADNADMEAQRYNSYGVGAIMYMSDKEVNEMLPFTPEVKPLFKEVVHKHVVDRILREHGVSSSPSKSKEQTKGPSKKADMVITTPDGARNISSDMAQHVISFKANEGKKNNGDKNDKNDKMNKLRGSNPRQEGESKQEWNNRLSKML